LLERFVQNGRVQIRQPRSHHQIRFIRTLSSGNSFVAFVDAIGEMDSTPCVLEWKTAFARYPEVPDGMAALDPQLICYSWFLVKFQIYLSSPRSIQSTVWPSEMRISTLGAIILRSSSKVLPRRFQTPYQRCSMPVCLSPPSFRGLSGNLPAPFWT
jgi:hypothetical protein